jgi:DNA-binding transcriptional LysR family regulator
MPQPVLSLDALRALDAIARKGSFAAAAEALYKVPSALSYTIAKLEQDLGVQLFDRSRQRAQLTSAGLLLLEQGRELLQASQRLEEQVRQLDSGWESRLRIVVDTIMPWAPLWQLTAEFTALERFTRMQFSEQVMAGTWEALLRDRCDIALGLAGEGVSAQIELHLLGHAEFAFAVPPTHPLAQRVATRPNEPIRREELLAYSAVVVADSAAELPGRDSGLFAAGHVLQVPTMQAKIAAQLAGVGVGFLPVHLIQQQLLTQQLVVLSTEIPRAPVPLYLGWRKDVVTGQASRWWREQLLNLPWQTLLTPAEFKASV